MNKLDEIQQDVVTALALQDLPASAARNYRRKSDQLPIFTRQEEKQIISKNALSSVKRSLKRRLAGSNQRDPSFKPFPRNYDIFRHIEHIEGRPETISSITIDLYNSQYDIRLPSQPVSPTMGNNSKKQSKEKSKATRFAKVEKQEDEIIDYDSDEAIDSNGVLLNAFDCIATIKGPGNIEGHDYDLSLQLVHDNTMCGNTGPPFSIGCEFIPRGCKRGNKTYDIVCITIPLISVFGWEICLNSPMFISKSGRYVLVQLPTLKGGLILLKDKAVDQLGTDKERLGGKLEAMENAFGVSKTSLHKNAKPSYTLCLKLPGDIVCHANALQDPDIQRLGSNCISPEFLHVDVVAETAIGPRKSSIQAVEYFLPVKDREDGVDIETMSNPADSAAARLRRRLGKSSADKDADALVDGMKSCSLGDGDG